MAQYNLIFGRVHFSDWRAEIEKLLKCARIKQIVFETDKKPRKQEEERKEVVRDIYIPLQECDWKRLFPQSENFVRIAGNKLLFQQFMEKQEEFVQFMPKTVKRSAPLFPCIVKKAVSNAGSNIYVVKNQQQLEKAIARFRNEQDYVIQEYIEHYCYGVAHFYVRDGRILFSRVYERCSDAPFPIVRGAIQNYTQVENHRFSPIFQRIFAAVCFSGAACVDFCTDPRTDNLKVFEINPRFGGSLVHNENDFLAMILTIAEAEQARC